MKRVFIIGVLSTIMCFCGRMAVAEIILGQSCALSGPTAFLGTEMNRGAKAYFDKYAKEITLNVLDDKYEPQLCIQNTNTFLDSNVHALFGYVGTPTSKVALPLAMAKKTIFFGAFTGVDFLSDHSANPFSFSVRASYDTEIENMVFHLRNDLGIKTISLFVQKDAFGLAGISGTIKALKKFNDVSVLPSIPEIPAENASEEEWNGFWKSIPNYERNTVAVGIGTKKIMSYRPQAVIMIGTYRPCGAAIKLWKEMGLDAIFMNISFVGTEALANVCRSDLKNIIVSQVVPDLWNFNIPLVKEYHDAIGNKEYGFVSMEGYIAAKILHQAIRTSGSKVNSEILKRSLESIYEYDLGGIKVSFGQTKHRAMDSVFLTKIEPGNTPNDFKFLYIDKIIKE